MAAIGKVAAVFTASTSGLTSGIKTASDAFRGLGGDAGSLNASLSKIQSLSFDSLRTAGPAATAASEAFASIVARAESLTESLQSGAISAEAFRDSMAALTQEASRQSQIYAAGAATTAQFATAQDKFSTTSASLNEQLAAGAISVETYGRAMSAAREALSMADGSAAAAAAAAADLAAVQQRGAAITEQFASAQSVYANAISELNQLLSAGAISQETYARASEAALDALSRADGSAAAAAAAAERLDAIMRQGASTTAQFATAEEQFAAATASLREQLAAGAISSETFSRAMESARSTLAEADGSAAASRAAMESLNETMRRGQAVTNANMTAQEKYGAELADLRELLAAGAINQQTFDRAVAAATSSLQNAGTASRDASSGLAAMASRLNALIGIEIAKFFASLVSAVSGAVRSLVSFGQAQAQVIDDASKMAARLGMTYGEFAGLSLAADLAGVSMDSIASASQKAEIAFARAAGGSAIATAAFAGLGLSVEELNGMSPAERFDAIAAAIAALPTEAERAAAAVRIFGRSGAELLPLFSGGAEGIAAAREEAERLGLTLSNAQGQDVEAMNDAFTMVSKAIAGVVQQVTAYLAPAITAIANTFVEFVGSIGGANIGQAIGDGILQGARFLAGIGDWLISGLSSVWEYVSQVGGQWGGVAEFLDRSAGFLSMVFNGAQAGLGMIILGFSGAFEGLATIAQAIGQYLGFDTSTLDAVVAGAQAFNATIADGITQNMAEMQAGYDRAFGERSGNVGQAIAGPLVTGLDAAIARAEASAAKVDEATKKPVEIKQAVEVNIDQALKGIDSRSKEGIAEMFRIMRGGAGDIQQQQLGVLEQIAENTSGGDDILSLEF